MDLFANAPNDNLLPCDGIVNYFGPVFDHVESDHYFDKLFHEIPWESDEVVIFGKRIITARKVAWHGDPDLSYTYSGTTKHARPWTDALVRLKTTAEDLAGCCFNSCLLNLYHDGNEGMSWHSDDEKSICRDTAIASLSFGAEREFRFKHKRSQQKVSTILEHGSLLLMKGPTQAHWLHSIPKSKKIKFPRVNLTFRMMVVS